MRKYGIKKFWENFEKILMKKKLKTNIRQILIINILYCENCKMIKDFSIYSLVPYLHKNARQNILGHPVYKYI